LINKITVLFPPTNKKETQVSLGIVFYRRMRVADYSQIVSSLYGVTQKENDFQWGPEQCLSPFSSFFPSPGGRAGVNREHLPLCLLLPHSKW